MTIKTKLVQLSLIAIFLMGLALPASVAAIEPSPSEENLMLVYSDTGSRTRGECSGSNGLCE